MKVCAEHPLFNRQKLKFVSIYKQIFFFSFDSQAVASQSRVIYFVVEEL